MHALQEGRFSIDVAAIDEHSTDFIDYLPRFQHMFQHRLNPDAIEGSIGERQLMAVCHQIGQVAAVDVGSDNTDACVLIQR